MSIVRLLFVCICASSLLMKSEKGASTKVILCYFSPRCIAFAALYNTMDRAEAEAGVCDGIVIHSFPVSITLFVLTL